MKNKTSIHLNNKEMQALVEHVKKCSVENFWIVEYATGIGNKIVVVTASGETDITDYESW